MDTVLQVVRRVQVDELQKVIDSLKESWSDLYSEQKEKEKKKKSKGSNEISQTCQPLSVIHFKR